MTLTGGKRKVNKSLKAWVAFVKKVQKEEKLSYKDAIHRAKLRKDKGEKWITGGESLQEESLQENTQMEIEEGNDDKKKSPTNTEMETGEENHNQNRDSPIDFSYIDEEDFVPIRNEDTPPSTPNSRGGKRKKKAKTHKKRQATRRKRGRSSRRR